MYIFEYTIYMKSVYTIYIVKKNPRYPLKNEGSKLGVMQIQRGNKFNFSNNLSKSIDFTVLWYSLVPISRDMTPLDFFLWGYLKAKVHINMKTLELVESIHPYLKFAALNSPQWFFYMWLQ